MRRIYLDFNASTPIAPEVAEAMRPFLAEHYGNPSSAHWAGEPARAAVEAARARVAALLRCEPGEVVFTSGGSESNNHALKGTFFRARSRPVHYITTPVEHPSVVEPLSFLKRLGADVTVVRVDGHGRVDPDEVRRAIRPDTALISVMHANNEVGTLQPVAEIAAVAREWGVPVHTDAAQSVGKVPVRLPELGADYLTVAGHKLYAPKGVGALVVRRPDALEPLVHGAGHEGGRRAGTENVLLAVGLGAACELAEGWLDDGGVRRLRDRFWERIRDRFGERAVLLGHPTERLPNTLAVGFRGAVGAELLARLDGVAASTGSACHSGRVEPSPVLRAMGVPPDVAAGAIRFSLGRTTTPDEVDETVRLLEAALGAAAGGG